jgi:ESF2/ABP1 family protein
MFLFHHSIIMDEPETKRKSKKTGVVFLPRVPKYMGPGEAKNYFQSFGFSINRSFFRPESRKAREARGKRGGNLLRKVFSEAWIEFERKSHAKMVAKSFNSQRVGGKASYCNDIWNIRYLSGFKFEDLMEEEVYKKEMHDRKVRQQIELAKQETQSYMETVSLAKKIEYAKKKRRERGEKVEDIAPRKVKQRKVASEFSTGQVGEELLQSIMVPVDEKRKKKRE